MPTDPDIARVLSLALTTFGFATMVNAWACSDPSVSSIQLISELFFAIFKTCAKEIPLLLLLLDTNSALKVGSLGEGSSEKQLARTNDVPIKITEKAFLSKSFLKKYKLNQRITDNNLLTPYKMIN